MGESGEKWGKVGKSGGKWYHVLLQCGHMETHTDTQTNKVIAITLLCKIKNMAAIQPRPIHILYQCAKCGDDRKSFNVICVVLAVRRLTCSNSMAHLKNWTDNFFQMFFMGTSWVAVSINNIKTRASREMTSRKNIKIFDFNGVNGAKHWDVSGRGICHL